MCIQIFVARSRVKPYDPKCTNKRQLKCPNEIYLDENSVISKEGEHKLPFKWHRMLQKSNL